MVSYCYIEFMESYHIQNLFKNVLFLKYSLWVCLPHLYKQQHQPQQMNNTEIFLMLSNYWLLNSVVFIFFKLAKHQYNISKKSSFVFKTQSPFLLKHKHTSFTTCRKEIWKYLFQFMTYTYIKFNNDLIGKILQ